MLIKCYKKYISIILNIIQKNYEKKSFNKLKKKVMIKKNLKFTCSSEYEREINKKNKNIESNFKDILRNI